MGKPGKSRVKFKRDDAAPPRVEVPKRSAKAVEVASSDEEDTDDVTGINFVPCAVWVPQGVSKRNPEKIEITKEELKRIIDETRKNLKELEEEEREESSEAQMDENSAGDDENIESKYGFDDYDDDNVDDMGFAAATTYGDNAEDPLLKSAPVGNDSDSEEEDFEIKPKDNLIVTGHFEDHCSNLEIYVYNAEDASLFVHHDLLLPSCPLALEWIDAGISGGKGNLVAVGALDPVIQVWDLDVINCLEPCCTLGERGSKLKKKKKSSQILGHTDAVLDLSWNKLNKQTLASGSVDQTAILWDFQQAKPSRHLRDFEEKVQCVVWHQSEVHSLLTACADGYGKVLIGIPKSSRKARLFDARAESTAANTWNCKASVDRVIWDPTNPTRFIAGREDGTISCFDVRQKKPLWRFHATADKFADLAMSDSCPGCLVTGSEEGEIQIWDAEKLCPETGTPVFIGHHDMNVGKIMFLRFCPDEPFVVCAGGDSKCNSFNVWDLRNTVGVVQRFGDRISGSHAVEKTEPMEEDSRDLNMRGLTEVASTAEKMVPPVFSICPGGPGPLWCS
ncbi:unnamed protein product [Notodromas monacha]|uniref:Periodic tryptophan protein 1 homolog n=1 Tax=Notodromas monacha TaxID=399045 RepID=A0A7R9BK38_9CRUS|nr:unnamed protein product [Notodromas monacha]CAG0915849.1 unnamed protein product [Notodromas monacha]